MKSCRRTRLPEARAWCRSGIGQLFGLPPSRTRTDQWGGDPGGGACGGCGLFSSGDQSYRLKGSAIPGYVGRTPGGWTKPPVRLPPPAGRRPACSSPAYSGVGIKTALGMGGVIHSAQPLKFTTRQKSPLSASLYGQRAFFRDELGVRSAELRRARHLGLPRGGVLSHGGAVTEEGCSP